MITVTIQDLLDRFPEFKDVPTNELNYYFEDAELFTGECVKTWGSQKRLNTAVLYCAAHMLVKYQMMQKSSDGAALTPKVITNKTVGDISVSWGGANKIPEDMLEDEFNTTNYGYRFLQLRLQRPRTTFYCGRAGFGC